jgi:peroxiredoxin
MHYHPFSKPLIWLLISILTLTLFTPLSVSTAQDDPLVTVQPVSGRYTLDIPSEWITTLAEISGLSGTFLGEIVTIADSPEAIRSLQNTSPNSAVIGQTLIANIFPTVSVTQGQPITDANDIFAMILPPDELELAEFSEINGLPAVQVPTYSGPPYEFSQFKGLTMILDEELIYFLVYGGTDEASLEHLVAIAATLTVVPKDQALLIDPTVLGSRDPFVSRDGRLELPMIDGWMVLSTGASGPSPVQSFIIISNPATSLGYAIGYAFDEQLPGLFIQVETQPYDYLYGTADYEPTDEDRSFILGQALANTGGEPAIGTQEITISDFPALRLEMTNTFGGDNNGVIVLIDAEQIFYTITLVGPADTWDTDYQPLVDAFIADVNITPSQNDVVINADGSETSIGTQVGQLAPDFTSTLLDGTTISLSDYRGKIVLVNFWATWCGPCRVEMPEFQRIYTERETDDFVVLAVNLMETPEQIQAYAEELGLTFPIAFDPNGEHNLLFNVLAYPTTYVLDAEGIIRIKHAGPVNVALVTDWIAIASE